MALDQFVFSITTAPFHELRRRRTWKHPSKARVGRRDARQYTGEGEDNITLSGLVAPEQIGSAASIDDLERMASVGEGYVLVDGLGYVYGVFVITGLEESARYFTKFGKPRKIEFSLSLERIDDDALLIDRPAQRSHDGGDDGGN